MSEVRQAIETWVAEVLSVKYAEFNSLPACAFAQQALNQGQVDLRFPPVHMPDVTDSLAQHEVVIYVFDPQLITATQLSDLAHSINQQHADVVALEDHPADTERVGTVTLNQGDFALLLIQDRQRLQKARQHLHSVGYYDQWPQEYYEDVVRR